MARLAHCKQHAGQRKIKDGRCQQRCCSVLAQDLGSVLRMYLRPWPHHSWVEPSLSLVKSFACEVRVRTGLLMPCCRSAFISEQWISTARTQLFISKIPQISPHTTVSGLVAGTIEKPLVQLPVHAPVPKGTLGATRRTPGASHTLFVEVLAWKLARILRA